MGAITNDYFTQFLQLCLRHNCYFVGVFHLGENDVFLVQGHCRFSAVPELLEFFVFCFDLLFFFYSLIILSFYFSETTRVNYSFQSLAENSLSESGG